MSARGEAKKVPSAAYRERVRREVLADPDLEIEIEEFRRFIAAASEFIEPEEGTRP